MSTRAVATSTLWQLMSQLVMAALSILTTKLIVVGLSKELVGNYNSAYGYLQMFGILADFGLYAVAVREVSRAEEKGRVLGALFVLRFIITCLSLGAAVALVWLSPAWRGTPLPLSVTIAASVPFFTLLAGMNRTAFQVHYRMHYVFIAEVAQRILTTGLIAYFVWVGLRLTEDTFYLHLFLATGGAGALLLYVISSIYAQRLLPMRLRWDGELIKKFAISAAPYGIAFLATALYRQLDVTLIALLRPDYETQNAYYGAVLRMTEMGYLIPTFLLNSTLPILSARDSKGEDTRSLLGKTFLLILLLGSTACLFAYVWARPLVQLLTSNAYLSTPEHAGSDTALALMSIPLLLNGIIQFCFYVMLNRHEWKKLVITLLFGSVLSLGLNLFFIPTDGFVGAAHTSILTHAVLAAALLPQALRIMPMRITLQQVGQWLGYSAVLGAALYLLHPFMTSELPTLIGGVIMLVIMGATLWAMGLMRTFKTTE